MAFLKRVEDLPKIKAYMESNRFGLFQVDRILV
jgi:hypothetical protein